RELGKGQRLPLAGVPYHAFEAYVGKLLKAGLRVAVCDQVEEAGVSRGLVRREVVRVLTPGTVVEDAFLEGGANYVVAICLRSHYHGVAALDCSTGELTLLRIEPTDEAVRDELARLRPAELVATENDRIRLTSLVGATPVSWTAPQEFDARAAVGQLLTLLGVETLAAFGCDEWPEALAAAGALLRHVERAHLRFEPGSLRADPLARARLQAELRGLPDLERITSRISQGFATPRDLLALRKALSALPGIRRIAAKWPELAAPLPPPSLQEVARALADALLDDLPSTLKDGGVFRTGFD